MIITKEKISAQQLALMIVPVIVATEFMSVPGSIYSYAREDSWISYLLSSLTGFWAIFVFTTLASRHPGLTLAQYSEIILGKWLGKLVNVYYTYYLFLLVISISDETMSFITLFAQPQTPRPITNLLLLFVCGIGAWLGVEVLARSAEFLVPLSMIFYIIVGILLLPEMAFSYLLPILGHGVYPIIQGGLVPSGWSGETFLLGFLLPYLNRPKLGRRSSLIGFGVVMFIMLAAVFQSIVINGPLTGQLQYAYYSAVRYATIGNFIERIDPLILGIWVYNGFLKTALFLWAFVSCSAQIFGFSNYRILVLPLTSLIVVSSFWVFSNSYELQRYLTYTFPFAAAMSQNVLPTVILFVDFIRFRKQGSSEQMAA